MGNVIDMTKYPWFDNTANIGHELQNIWKSVKKDISRIASLSKDDNLLDSSNEINRLIKNVKRKLHQVTEIRFVQKNISDDWWHQILYKTLLIVYENKQDTKFNRDFQELIASDQNDVSATAIDFIQAYMIKVARISKNRVIIPFKPHK